MDDYSIVARSIASVRGKGAGRAVPTRVQARICPLTMFETCSAVRYFARLLLGLIMIRLQCLLLTLCAVTMIGPAATAQSLRPDSGASGAQGAQRIIVCGPHRGCRRVKIRAGCRRMMLGGWGRHNYRKLVCG